jgi:hypothetical protein
MLSGMRICVRTGCTATPGRYERAVAFLAINRKR